MRTMGNPDGFDVPSALDRAFNRVFGVLLGLGLGFRHNRLLEVRGRRSGRLYVTPVDVLAHGGRRYLVAPRGETQWVRNARTSGRVVLRRGGTREAVTLRAVPDAGKPELLKAYLDRFHRTVQRFFPVRAGAAVADFVPLVARYPVFEIFTEPIGTSPER